MQVLYNLVSHVLKFNRLNEIGVPLQVVLTIQSTSLHVLVMFYNTDLFLLYDAVRQCLPVFVLLSLEDKSLLVGMNPFFVFTLTMVSLAFDIERNRLASQRLDDDLHVTMQPALVSPLQSRALTPAYVTAGA